MIYEEFPSPDDLRPVIACFWRFALASTDPGELTHVIPPDGTVSIAWLPQGFAMVVGPRMDALRVTVHRGCEYLGLRLRPGAAGSVLGIQASSLRSQNIPLLVCAPRLVASIRPASIETLISAVRAWPRTSPKDPRPLVWIDRLLDDPEASVADLAAGSRLSYRQMLRLFYDAAGLTPKEFARLRRIRQACIRACEAHPGGWAAISSETGFADQAHLSREFADVFGWTPRLTAEYLRRIEHRGVR